MKRMFLTKQLAVVTSGFFFCLAIASATHAQSSQPTNAQHAVTAALKSCLLPLMRGKNPDEEAKRTGLVQVPEEIHKPFKKRPIDKAGYFIKPGEVLLLTTTRPTCMVTVRTLDVADLKAQIERYFTEANHFKKLPDRSQGDAHHLQFVRDQADQRIWTLITYSDQPREDGMQGLITVAVMSKDSQ